MSRKIAVICYSLNPSGGAEKVTAVTIDVLRKRMGFDTTLYLYEKPNSNVLLYYKKYLNGTKIKYLSEYLLPKLGRPFGSSCNEFFARLRNKHGLLMDTSGIKGPLMCSDIIYLHEPYLHSGLVKDSSIIKKIGLQPLQISASLLNNIILREQKHERLIIANSLYTLNRFSEVLDLKEYRTCIIYPPVETKKILSKTNFSAAREDIAVSISRIGREKNLHLVPKIANKLKGVKFLICGPIRDTNYLKEIRSDQKSLNIRNMRILPGYVNEKLAQKMLEKSKVCFNLNKVEPFGMSIVEGMANGLIPIVSNFGGPKEFVPEKWRFKSMDEIAEKIETAICSWNPELAREIGDSTLKFDTSKFYERIENELRSFL
jgi:glycosyltransferase involved in cell wall biosynthesis